MLSKSKLLLKKHRLFFNDFIKENKIELKNGHLSKAYTFKLDNQIVTLRFKNVNSQYIILLKDRSKSFKLRKPFYKDSNYFIFDKKLNTWHRFAKELFFQSLLKNDFKIDMGNNFGKLTHALSDTEKELLAAGKDVTVNINLYSKIDKKPRGFITINATADYSYFLGSNSLVINSDSQKQQKTLNIIKE